MKNYNLTKFSIYTIQAIIAVVLTILLCHIHEKQVLLLKLKSTSGISEYCGVFICMIAITEGIKCIFELIDFSFKNIPEYFKVRRERKRIKKAHSIVEKLTILNKDLEKSKENILIELEDKLNSNNLSEEEKEKALISFLDRKDKFDSLHETVKLARLKMNTTLDSMLELNMLNSIHPVIANGHNRRMYDENTRIRAIQELHNRAEHQYHTPEHLSDIINIANIHDEMEDAHSSRMIFFSLQEMMVQQAINSIGIHDIGERRPIIRKGMYDDEV